MFISQTRRLLDRYRPLLIGALLTGCTVIGRAQTYNPSTCCTVSNKSYGAAQAVPTDGRSQFYDASNLVMRDYNGTSEVLSYLNLAKYRTGHFPIYVHSGGVLQPNGTWVGGSTLVYWFKDSTANANLVRWYTDSTGLPGGPFFAIANNLSEGNAGLIKGNLNLDLVDNTSDAQKNAAAVSLTNHTINGSLNTLTNIPNSALVNNSIGLTITDDAASDVSVTTTPAALGSSLVVNMPDAGTASRGPLKAADWNFFNGKLDSVHISNDSVYNCVNGTCTLQSVIVGAGAVNSVNGTNASLLFSPSTGDVLGQVNPAYSFNWTGQHSFLSFAPIFSTLTTAGGLFYGNGSGQLLQSGAGSSGQILRSSGGTAPTFFTPDASTVNGWLGYTALSNALGSTHLFVGNGSNVATDVALSGDASILNTGQLTNIGLKGKLLPSLTPGFLEYDGVNWLLNGSAIPTVDQGLYDSSNTFQLGEPLNQSGNPAQFYQNREIPLNGKSLTWWDTANNVSGGRMVLNDTQYTSLIGNVKVQMRQFADQANDAKMWNAWYPRNYGTLYANGKPNGAPMKALGWSWGYSENSSGGLPAPDNVYGGGYNIINATARADTGDAALSLRVETNFNVLGANGAFEMHWPELTRFSGVQQRVNSWYVDKTNGNTLWESNLNLHEYKKIFQHVGEDWLKFNSNGDDYPTITMIGTHKASIDGIIQYNDSNGHQLQLRSIDADFSLLQDSHFSNTPLYVDTNAIVYLNNRFTAAAPLANTIIGNYDDGSYPSGVASAQLAVVNQHKGFLPPVMTTTQMNAITSPAAGLCIINSTDKQLAVFSNFYWETHPGLVGEADLTGQTASANMVTFEPATNGTYRVGGYITITAISVDVIQLQVTYTDETSTNRTIAFYPLGAASPSLSATGLYVFPTVDIRAQAANPITVSATLTVGGGTITYDAGGSLMRIK